MTPNLTQTLNHEWLPENFPRFDLCFLNNKFIFINIPKNASTSIRGSLSLPIREPYSRYANSNTHKTLVVIRNPIQRVISSFMELLKVRKDGPYWETTQTEWFKIHKINIERSFQLFIDYIENRLYDSHIHRQCDYIEKKGLKIEDIDYVFLFENLKEDFSLMCNELNINKTLKWNNKTNPASPKNIVKKLVKNDKGLRSKIEKIYKDDIYLYEKILTTKNNILNDK